MAPSYVGDFVSVWASTESASCNLRYTPVVGCGNFYREHSITEDVVDHIATHTILPYLETQGVRVDQVIARSHHCQYDGWVVDIFVNGLVGSEVDHLLSVVKELDQDLPDTHLDYVDLS